MILIGGFVLSKYEIEKLVYENKYPVYPVILKVTSQKAFCVKNAYYLAKQNV